VQFRSLSRQFKISAITLESLDFLPAALATSRPHADAIDPAVRPASAGGRSLGSPSS
jgi:hypothetical protein